MGLKFILNSNILLLVISTYIVCTSEKMLILEMIRHYHISWREDIPMFPSTVRLSVLVTGFDQNAHCRSFLIISPVCSRFFLSVFFHAISNLLYDCNLFLHFLSIPNIVDPKSLTLLNVHQIFSLPWFLIVLMDILINLHLNAGWD